MHILCPPESQKETLIAKEILLLLHVNDVLFCGSEAGVCLACLCGDGGALAVLVERLVLVAELSPQSAAWRQSAERIVWSAGAVDVATAWREERRSLSISLVVIRI
jgi:hypothetical protein